MEGKGGGISHWPCYGGYRRWWWHNQFWVEGRSTLLEKAGVVGESEMNWRHVWEADQEDKPIFL